MGWRAVTVVAILLALTAAGMSARWWLRRYDALGRPRRFPYLSVTVIAVLAVSFAVPPYLRHREEGRLSAVASKLVGTAAAVHCETVGQGFTDLSGDLGFVRFGADGVPEHRTTISRGPCANLRHYMDSGKQRPTPDEVIAVHVLTHESMHMRGQPSESLAECEAVQRDAQTARLLGASPAQAFALARVYWRVDYPLLPDNYRTTGCAPGGALDEHLPDAPWAGA